MEASDGSHPNRWAVLAPTEDADPEARGVLAGADLDWVLTEAFGRGDLALIRQLCSSATLNQASFRVRHLVQAAATGSDRLMRLLQDELPGLMERLGSEALDEAGRVGNLGAIRTLLVWGVPIDFVTLRAAVRAGSELAVQTLLRWAPELSPSALLPRAARRGVSMLQLLADYGADLRQEWPEVLFQAILVGDLAVVKWVLMPGRLWCRNVALSRALRYAVQLQPFPRPMAEWLLREGAEPGPLRLVAWCTDRSLYWMHARGMNWPTYVGRPVLVWRALEAVLEPFLVEHVRQAA